MSVTKTILEDGNEYKMIIRIKIEALKQFEGIEKGKIYLANMNMQDPYDKNNRQIVIVDIDKNQKIGENIDRLHVYTFPVDGKLFDENIEILSYVIDKPKEYIAGGNKLHCQTKKKKNKRRKSRKTI
jgi:hypothetical protein